MEDRINIKVARIYRYPNNSSIKAFVDLSINEKILIKGFRVVEGPKGIFVTMPQEKAKKNERWYNTVHCLKRSAFRQVVDCVLEAYSKEATNGNG